MRTHNSISMKALLTSLLVILFAIPAICSADDNATVRKFGPMQGVPVNIGIGGGGTVPAGHMITAINSSFREKYESVKGDDVKTNANMDNTLVVNLLKIRYGVTDRWEVNTTVPYNTYDPATGKNLDSLGDINVGVTYSFLLERDHEPMNLSLAVKAGLPTGEYGSSHLPGNGAWSTQAALGLTKTFGLSQVAFDLYGTMPFEKGNSQLRKGASGGFNYKYAYALGKYLDAGIEGTIETGENGDRLGTEVKNGYTEWYTGPALNFNIPGTTSVIGVAAYLPVYRAYEQNTSSESVRFDFKFLMYW